MKNIQAIIERAPERLGLKLIGNVISSQGPILEAKIPGAALGDYCTINISPEQNILAEIVGFDRDLVRLAPLDDTLGISPGAEIISHGKPIAIECQTPLVGSVIGATGNLLYRQGNSNSQQLTSLQLRNSCPLALDRKPISEKLVTGVSAIDCFCPVGHGQRLGLIAAAGVGKSTLLGMIARYAEVDVTVVGLIGERGREVREFIDDSLGPEGLARSIVVVATSDESANKRRLAAYTATSIAEHYRSMGLKVLLLFDSLTRFARAIREIGLACGEVPVRHGYPPSLFSELPRLLERSGCNDKGSITAIYTVLSDNERELDPLAEEVKSILDGHITLSQRVSDRGVRPAVDVPRSISRLLPRIENSKTLTLISKATKILARLRQDRDLILLGGNPDPDLLATLAVELEFEAIINQPITERRASAVIFKKIESIIEKFEEIRDQKLKEAGENSTNLFDSTLTGDEKPNAN